MNDIILQRKWQPKTANRGMPVKRKNDHVIKSYSSYILYNQFFSILVPCTHCTYIKFLVYLGNIINIFATIIINACSRKHVCIFSSVHSTCRTTMMTQISKMQKEVGGVMSSVVEKVN